MTDRTETLQTRKQEFVRGEIWSAAIDLFAHQGFDDTTVDEIAERAGVSRRTFFRYFASKDELMAQGIESYAAAITLAIENCDAKLPPGEVVHRAVLAVSRAIVAQPQIRQAMQVMNDNPKARGAQLGSMAVLQQRVASAFTSRLRKKSKEPLIALVLASLTVSMLDLTLRSWYAEEAADVAKIVDRVFATYTRLGFVQSHQVAV